MAFGTTPISTTSLGANQFPVSAVYVQGTSGGNLTAVQGGPVSSADGNGNVSAPVALYVPDGNDVTLGTTTDASSANTLIGLTKAVKANTASVTVGVLPALPAGSNTIGNVGLIAGSALIGSVELVDSAGTNKATISAAGAVKVDGSGTTQPVSGTFWQATQPISAASLPLPTGAAQDSSVNGLLLAQGSTTSGEKGPLILGAVTTAAPSYTTAQSSPLSLTTAGALRTDGSATTQPVSGSVTANAGSGTFTIQSNASVNLTQVAGSSVATAATGIAKVGLTDGSGTAITSTASALDVNIKSGGGSGFSVVDEAAWTAGSSSFVPSGGVFNDSAAALTSGQEGASRLTNNRALHVNLRDASANQLLGSKTSANSIPVVIASDQGAYPVSQSGSWSVTANAGTNLNTSALALDTSVNGLLLAQASTTSGQKGPLVLGAVTTNAPSYTTAQSSPLSLDTSGLVRASLKDTPSNTNNFNVNPAASAATVTISGTVTANQGGAPWSSNTTQIAGSSIATSATGVQKVGIVGNAGATVDATVGAGTAPTNALVTAGIYNTSAPTPTNGQSMSLQLDQAGNARVFPGIALAALSAWSSGSSLNATQVIFSNSGAESVLLQLDQTTTITAGAVTFEATFDGTNWITVPANCIVDPTSTIYGQIANPYTFQANTNKPFVICNNGWQSLRLRLSTQISGTGTVTPNYALLAYDVLPSIVALSPTAANFNVTIGSGGNTIGAVTQASGPWTSNITQFGGNALATGTGASGSGIPRVTVANDSNVLATQSGTWTQVPNAATSGGSTASHTMSAASTNATSLKASAGQVYGLSISNANASARYFKLYNKASSPNVGTDTPVLTVQVPGNGTVIRAYPVGLALGTGIAWAATGAITDADTTAIGANDLSVDIDYK